ncbi:hypothetical protein [Clostridium sp.]|uniref:DUF7852 domain-containing protein n=1 Tax=Clostridium sp. TaxID=1506 RepID=UPI003D6DA501
MIPFNNYDNLGMLQLLIIWELLEQLPCNVFGNKPIKKNLVNNKSNMNSNNLSVEKEWKDKINTECIPPIQQVNIGNEPKCINGKNEIDNSIYTTDDIKNTNSVNPNNCSYKEKSEIINSHTFPLNSGINIAPVGTNEPVVTMLNIVLTEKNIDIPIESILKSENSALDIKNIKKDLYLTNSILLPIYDNHDISPSLSGKLFLEGFIRNKLDFYIAKDVHNGIINLASQSVITYIPFKCTTLIQFKTPPVLSKEKNPDYIPIYISSHCVNIKKYIDYGIHPINCEIKEAKIHETYTLMDKSPFNKNFPIEMEFHTIKEKIIVNLSITLLQEQDVAVNYKNNPE